MIAKTNIDCFRGDTKSWTITISHDGDLVDLTGAKIWMTAMRSQRGSRVFQRTSEDGEGIIIDPDQDANTGQATIKLASSSTSDLPNEVVTLYYDIQVLTAAGDLSTDIYGDLVVTPDATTEVH